MTARPLSTLILAARALAAYWPEYDPRPDAYNEHDTLLDGNGPEIAAFRAAYKALATADPNQTMGALAAQALQDVQAITDRTNRIEGEHHQQIAALHTQLTAAGIAECHPDDDQQGNPLPLNTRLAELIDNCGKLAGLMRLANRLLAVHSTLGRHHALGAEPRPDHNGSGPGADDDVAATLRALWMSLDGNERRRLVATITDQAANLRAGLDFGLDFMPQPESP